MHISSQGIALIQNYEGLRTTAYKPLKKESGWTIGYGHQGPDVKPGMVCTEQWAYEQLKRDLRQVEHQLISALNADEIEVTQGQFDALCSLLFNLSGGILRLVKFKLWAKLKAGDVKGAANEFLDISKAGGQEVRGLTLRRSAEARLFLS
uniref:Endolysin n=1 Tax=Siphoviridae sp. ctJ3t72 TaxID=2826240 RepID=A0A8S5QMT8_9CAUD|nr:MAG TPA: Lysozyme [Siphoviridae sp. ctJ3t72]